MTDPAGTPIPAPPLFSHRQILVILAGLMSGMFLAALDQTIVSTAIRTIADDLDGLSLQAWVTTAYLITSTLTTPLYGKLSDIYGRKPLFLFAITVFVLGSVACTFSTSMYQLAGFRALQGVGAGGLFSMALTIVGDIVPPRQRAKYQGYFVAVFGTSSVLGPLAGGFLAGQNELLGITGWRWVFLVNVPIGIAALLIVARVLNLPSQPQRGDKRVRVDWPGALTLALGLVPLLLVAEQGRSWGWASTSALICYAFAVTGLVLFVLAEWNLGDDALMPLRAFRNRTFSVGTAASVLVGMGMFGGLASLPLYLQIVKGASPTASGLLTLPLVLGIMSMSILSGQIISRTGRLRRWPVLGVTLMIIGLFLLSRVGVATPFWETALFMLTFGWGLGCCMQPLTLAMQNAMPPKDMGMATASATFFRQVGGTLGTAVFLSILFSTVNDKIGSAFRAAAGTPGFQAALADPAVRADPANRVVLDAVSGTGGGIGGISLDDTQFLSHLDPRLALPFLQGFAGSMSVTFLFGAAVLAVALALVVFLPEVTLRQQSGIEARRSQDAPPPAVAGAEHAVASAVPVAVAEQAVRPGPRLGTASGPEPNPVTGPGSPRGRRSAVPVGAAHGADAYGADPDRADREPVTGRMSVAVLARPSGAPARSRPDPEAARSHPEPGTGEVRASGSMPAEARDRLLGQLVPDVDGTVASLRAAEQARDDVRRARRELNERTMALIEARRDLVRRGLTPEQVDRVLRLSGAEAARPD